ncbi:hypothetical protein CYMTET_6944 [Cymbomonas tetramitiformis]|nr:hypothetical protein CYMTET_6944 [Cymbomonas tetramitiformis]
MIKTDQKIPDVGTSRRKATQVWGSLPATGLREALRKAEDEEKRKADAAELQQMFAACAQELESIELEMAGPERQAQAAEKEAEKLRKEAEKQAERARKDAEKAEREAEKARKDAEKAAEKARKDAEKAEKSLERERKKRERERVAQEKKAEVEARKKARVQLAANRVSAQEVTESGSGCALSDITNVVQMAQ